MENSSKKALKSGAWYTITNFIIKGINFITIPIFTRLLSTSEFGDYNNFASWLSLITVVATLSLSASLVRARFDFKEQLHTYIKSILILGTLVTLVLFLITRVSPQSFSDWFSMPDKYICIMFLYFAVYPAMDMFQDVQRFNYKYKISIGLSIFVALSTVMASLLFMYKMEDKLTGRIIGAYAPLIVLAGVFYIHFFMKGGNVNLSYWKYALAICIPYVPHLLAMTVLNSTDRVMIKRICGADATAYYSLAYTCAMVVHVLWSSFNTAFSPWLGEKLNKKEYASIKDMSPKYVLLFAVLVVGVLLLSPELILILGGSEYGVSKYVMPPVMLGCFFQFLYSMYVNIEQFEKKTVGMAIASCLAALINLGLNAWLIPIYGYIAAAYTTLIGYVFLFFMHYLIVKKIGLSFVYDTKKMLLISVVMVAIGILVNFLYSQDILRTIFILLYIGTLTVMLLKNKELILSFIKK